MEFRKYFELNKNEFMLKKKTWCCEITEMLKGKNMTLKGDIKREQMLKTQ